MSSGQTRVVVLLLVLLGLELIRQPALVSWFKSAWSSFGNALNSQGSTKK